MQDRTFMLLASVVDKFIPSQLDKVARPNVIDPDELNELLPTESPLFSEGSFYKDVTSDGAVSWHLLASCRYDIARKIPDLASFWKLRMVAGDVALPSPVQRLLDRICSAALQLEDQHKLELSDLEWWKNLPICDLADLDQIALWYGNIPALSQAMQLPLRSNLALFLRRQSLNRLEKRLEASSEKGEPPAFDNRLCEEVLQTTSWKCISWSLPLVQQVTTAVRETILNSDAFFATLIFGSGPSLLAPESIVGAILDQLEDGFLMFRSSGFQRWAHTLGLLFDHLRKQKRRLILYIDIASGTSRLASSQPRQPLIELLAVCTKHQDVCTVLLRDNLNIDRARDLTAKQMAGYVCRLAFGIDPRPAWAATCVDVNSPLAELFGTEFSPHADYFKVAEVQSQKMVKTVVAQLEIRKPHPRFGKIIRRHTKFYAHDEYGKAQIGDVVLLAPTRRQSKLKRWRLVAILGRRL